MRLKKCWKTLSPLLIYWSSHFTRAQLQSNVVRWLKIERQTRTRFEMLSDYWRSRFKMQMKTIKTCKKNESLDRYFFFFCPAQLQVHVNYIKWERRPCALHSLPVISCRSALFAMANNGVFNSNACRRNISSHWTKNAENRRKYQIFNEPFFCPFRLNIGWHFSALCVKIIF